MFPGTLFCNIFQKNLVLENSADCIVKLLNRILSFFFIYFFNSEQSEELSVVGCQQAGISWVIPSALLLYGGIKFSRSSFVGILSWVKMQCVYAGIYTASSSTYIKPGLWQRNSCSYSIAYGSPGVWKAPPPVRNFLSTVSLKKQFNIIS